MMDMGGASQDVIDKAARMYVDLLADPNTPGGALITPEEKDGMEKAIAAGPTAVVDKTNKDQATLATIRSNLTTQVANSRAGQHGAAGSVT
jgi:hypothetical protein